MRPKIIDISLPIKKGMPIWPGSAKPCLGWDFQIKKGDKANVTQLKIDVHTGTHLEGPLHFIPDGISLDKMPLNRFIGEAMVVYLPKVKSITADDLKKLSLPKHITRLLFRTSNSNFWQKGEKKFQKNYVGLNSDAANWLVEAGIQLVGIDYLSIAKYDETVKVHRILLKNEVIILEGLNLSGVKPGFYQLICFPIKLFRKEAAPARAVLLSL
jgi:arylformamidase